MKESVKAALLDSKNEFHTDFLKLCLGFLGQSKGAMGAYYGAWDEADRIFRTRTIKDEQDRKAAQRREPAKILLPFTRAQILTFVSFGFLQLNQRDTFYELQGTGPEDEQKAEQDAEDVLARECKRNKWNAFLNQSLLDCARFGICVAKVFWEEKTKVVTSQQPVEAGETVAGEPTLPTTQDVTEPTVVSQGNRVIPISPFRFYPDTSRPLSRFQEGDFCGSEDVYSYTTLKSMEAGGEIVGTEDIKPLSSMQNSEMFSHSRFGKMAGLESSQRGQVRGVQSGAKTGPIVVTELQMWLIPADTKLGGSEETLGPEKERKLYLVWLGNWSRILKVEEMGVEHDQFTYQLGQFTEDQNTLLNEGMAELIGPLQETATWFINSRISNVKKTLYGGIMVVDDSLVEYSDLQNRSQVIRLKPNAKGRLDATTNGIRQIDIKDSTSGHVADVETLWKFVQVLSGASENAMGQYSGGRRDATQSRAVNQGASARLKTIIWVLWETFFEPIGKMMLFNAQQSLTSETFAKIVGEAVDPARFEQFHKRDVLSLDNYDFEMFDGTSPSEKGYIAQTMQDLFLGMFANPEAMMMLVQPGNPLRPMLVEIAELRGIKNAEQWLPPVQQQIQPPNVTNINQPPTPGIGLAPAPTSSGTIPS